MHSDHSTTDADLASDLSNLRLNGDKSNISLATDAHEEREVPGKGIGVFATKPIAAGSRVICEKPLLILSDDEDVLNLYRVVMALDEQSKSRFWALAASIEPHRDTDWIDELYSSWQGEPDDFDALIEDHVKVMSIYETNRFSLRSSDGSIKRLGVFPKAARINHSCTPNIFHRYNPNIGCLTMHALRDIEEGEELATSYIDICQATAERRRVLSHWGFICECETCCANSKIQNQRRRRLEDLLAEIEDTERRRRLKSWIKSYYVESLEALNETMALMEEEEMYESDTLGKIYRIAAKHAAVVGSRKAVKLAAKAVEVERKCCGEDSIEYAKATALLSRLQRRKS